MSACVRHTSLSYNCFSFFKEMLLLGLEKWLSAGEILLAQRLKVYDALAMDPSLVPSTHVRHLTTSCTSGLQTFT